MKKLSTMQKIADGIYKTGEKSFYIEIAPGTVKYCSAERLEKLRERTGIKEDPIARDKKLVAEYRKRTGASAPNVEVDIVPPAPVEEGKPETATVEG